MKKTALYLLVLPLFFAACKSKCKEDLGIHSSRDFTVKPFDEVKVSGPIKLIMRQDSSFKINILADSNAIGLVKAEVSGSKLTVKLDGNYCGKDSVIVNAGIGDLKKLTADGPSKVYTASGIIVNTLDVELTGAVKLNLDVSAMKLTTTTNGAAVINLLGQAGVHQVKSTGSIRLNAYAFVAGIYNLDLNGVSDLKINALNDLKIKTSGAADIRYKGNPKNIQEKQSGTYKLEKVN